MIKGQDWVQLLEINETSNFIFGDTGVLFRSVIRDILHKINMKILSLLIF